MVNFKAYPKQYKLNIQTNTKELKEFNLSYDIENDYFCEANLIEDTNIYSVRVYDTLHSDVNPYNANEVIKGLFDSAGNTFGGMEIEIDVRNNPLITQIKDDVFKVLFITPKLIEEF